MTRAVPRRQITTVRPSDAQALNGTSISTPPPCQSAASTPASRASKRWLTSRDWYVLRSFTAGSKTFRARLRPGSR